MYKYKYKNNLQITYKGIKSCPIPDMFKKWITGVKNDSNIRNEDIGSLSLDDKGMCIFFHSEDLVFKSQSKIFEKFNQLLQIIKSYSDIKGDLIKSINLSEVKISTASLEDLSLDKGIEENDIIEFNAILYFF